MEGGAEPLTPGGLYPLPFLPLSIVFWFSDRSRKYCALECLWSRLNNVAKREEYWSWNECGHEREKFKRKTRDIELYMRLVSILTRCSFGLLILVWALKTYENF